MAPPAAAAIVGVWDGLEISSSVSLPEAAPLGYRGCTLKGDRGQEWTAFAGVACLKTGPDRGFRADRGRRFERAVLATAPADELPPLPGL